MNDLISKKDETLEITLKNLLCTRLSYKAKIMATFT